MSAGYTRFAMKLAIAVALGLTIRVVWTETAGRDLALRRQMTEATRQRAAGGGPKFELPADQRAGWIAAWNKLRACAKSHGFDGVTPVEPSFGDGLTPSPVIAGSGPAFDRAMRQCAFDPHLFDAAKVQAAIQSQLAEIED